MKALKPRGEKKEGETIEASGFPMPVRRKRTEVRIWEEKGGKGAAETSLRAIKRKIQVVLELNRNGFGAGDRLTWKSEIFFRGKKKQEKIGARFCFGGVKEKKDKTRGGGKERGPNRKNPAPFTKKGEKRGKENPRFFPRKEKTGKSDRIRSDPLKGKTDVI